MRPGRNPRRGYDEEGREITSAMVASTQRNGARGIIARCACNHEALLPFDGLHPVRSRCEASSGVVRLRHEAAFPRG